MPILKVPSAVMKLNPFKSGNYGAHVVELRNIKFIIGQRLCGLPTLLGFLVVKFNGFPQGVHRSVQNVMFATSSQLEPP